jgi:hemerythrin
MAIVTWDGSLSIGVDVIDKQHKELFNSINRFQERSATENPTFALDVVLDSLKNYVRYHFASEERLLELNNCPELERHKQLHAAFEEHIRLYEAKHASVTREELGELQSFLLNWLTNHIQGEDHRLKQYLQP